MLERKFCNYTTDGCYVSHKVIHSGNLSGLLGRCHPDYEEDGLDSHLGDPRCLVMDPRCLVMDPRCLVMDPGWLVLDLGCSMLLVRKRKDAEHRKVID